MQIDITKNDAKILQDGLNCMRYLIKEGVMGLSATSGFTQEEFASNIQTLWTKLTQYTYDA